jgi:hypothetical protein
LYVLGFGAEYSDGYPYRSPEAQEIRERLAREGVILFERPQGATDAELSRHMEKLLG